MSSPENSCLVEAKPRLAIVGVGNLLLQDEGVGIHLIQALKEAPLAQEPGVELIDGGTAFPPLPGGLDKLIIVDAVKGGGEPGTIYRFGMERLGGGDGVLLSPHQLSLWEDLRLMELENTKPKEVVIFGVEPEKIDWGLELSPKLEEKLPQLVRLVLREVGEE